MTVAQVTYQILEFIGEAILAVFIFGYIVREFQEFLRHYKIGSQYCQTCVQNRGEGNDKLECHVCGRKFNPFQNSHCPTCQREIESSHICWRGYFMDVWNIIDILNLGLFIFVLVVRFWLRGYLYTYDYNTHGGFLNFYPVAEFYYMGSWLNSFNAWLCFLKSFKYLAKIKQLRVLIRAILYSGTVLPSRTLPPAPTPLQYLPQPFSAVSSPPACS